MAITRPRPDILIRSAEGNPIAVVEVKNLQNLTREEAIELRGNLVAYGIPTNVSYFLLLSQDVGFLWVEPKNARLDAPPDYEFPMDKVVARYSNANSQKRLYEGVLVYIILEWLTDLANNSQGLSEEPEKILAISGFTKSIKGAMILLEEAL